MASDVREYLRAAQAAEIQGDKARAAELLRTAAGAYQEAGNQPRAEQMLRHARRLEARSPVPDPARPMPDKTGEPMRSPPPAPGGAEQAGRRSRATDPEFAERGPTLADPTAPAWCSFCCRPRDEVGRLVAAPAGAFICATCVAQCNSLLGAASSTAAPIALRDGPPAVVGEALRNAARALEQAASRLEALESEPGGDEVKALVDRLPRGAGKPASGAARSRGSSMKKRRRR